MGISGYGSTANDLADSSRSWLNVVNVLGAPDLTLAGVTGKLTTPSNTLVVVTNDGGEMASLPTNATILGLTVTLLNTDTSDSPFSNTTYTVTPCQNSSGTVWGLGEVAKTGSFPASNGNITLGGPADLWSMSGLTSAALRSHAWGAKIVIASSNASTITVDIDAVQFTITYSVPAADTTTMRPRLPGRRNRGMGK